MQLEGMVKTYRSCPLDGDEPGEAEVCKTCALNLPVFEYSEQPTYCSALNKLESSVGVTPEELLELHEIDKYHAPVQKLLQEAL